MITLAEFAARGLELSREAQVLDSHHHYFIEHSSRLFKTCALFGLLDRRLGDVLEIGPFYGYIPFLLRPNSSRYVVLEGDEPAGYPLRPLFQKHQIQAHYVDLFEMFGPTREAAHRLEFADCSFDTVLCWETMEHFNFNPVKFVRELHRVLKPGGRAYITVPNKASFYSLCSLLLGRSENKLIDSYFATEDYMSNGKRAFFGFHWREYSAGELAHLFSQAGFTVLEEGTFLGFQNRPNLSVLARLNRKGWGLLQALLPRYGSHVRLVAEK